jgi:hypothetical protein
MPLDCMHQEVGEECKAVGCWAEVEQEQGNNLAWHRSSPLSVENVQEVGYCWVEVEQEQRKKELHSGVKTVQAVVWLPLLLSQEPS